ncbi:TIGR04066 family peptide maturation system protein [Clostridium botulinum]|nr:TIGR04066 family peptide maturation system protein [Clostridium botulinum]
MCESRKVNFSHCVCEEKYNILNMEAVQLEKIQTPIIFVLGTGDRSGKFEIQLCLRENLMQMGYKVSQVGSRNYCELMDFHSFPQFMYSTEITEEEKVIYFNNFIKDIELNDNSDVIIIGIPGGIMPFNDKYTNGFGILAYEISQAVKPDAAVFTTLYEDYNKEYFESIDNTIKYKFGFEIDCYNLSNIQFDWMKFENLNEQFYITLDYNFISKRKIN